MRSRDLTRRSLPRLAAGALAAALLLGAATACADPWRFVVTGDSRGPDGGINAAVLGETARAIVEERAEVVLFTGDLVTGNTDPATFERQLLAWRAAMAPVYQAGVRVFAVQGNHETGVPGSAKVWNRVFSGPYAMPANGPPGAEGITYAASHRDALVLALDQTHRRVELAWVTAQLAAAKAPHRFAMGHYPAFKVLHEDNLDDDAENRDAFWRALGRSGVRVYFAGHDHFFDHARIDDGDGDAENDVHQLILGGGGAPLYSDGAYDGENGSYVPRRVAHDRAHGYAVVELDGPRVTITWKRRVEPGVFRGEGAAFTYEVQAAAATPPAQ